MVGAGELALWAAVIGCGLTVGAGVADRQTRVVRGVAVVSAGAATLATIALATAFWRHDFSVVYVADHSRRGLPALDRVSGVWGGMGGSLLLFGALVTVLGVMGTRSVRATAVAVGAGGALLAADLWLVNPFATLAIPAIDGSGLTPILEHPAMRIHPPLVYLGLCVLVVPFALAVVGQRPTRSRSIRRWLVASWTLLGLGMMIGSWWAYAELGWGGYWAWDPVENTALVPWLAVTTALHVRDPAVGSGRTTVVAAAAPFPLAILGAVLTRSGATGSVHAFAEATAVGRALLVLLVVLVAVVAAAALWSRSAVVDQSRRVWWRTSAVALLATITAIVAVGTLFPVVRSWLGGDRSLVAGSWFSAMTWPAAVVGLWLLVVSRSPRVQTVALRWWAVRLSAGALVGLTAGIAGWPAPAVVLAGTAALCVVAVAPEVRRPSGLAHVGLAILLIGVAGTASGSTVSGPFVTGETVSVGGHEVELTGIDVENGPVSDSSAVVATVDVDGHVLRPSLVAYPRRDVLLAETSLRSTPLVDVQVVLRNAGDDGTAVLTVHVNPLQQLVWWGGLVLVVAGAWAFAAAGDRSERSRARRVGGSESPVHDSPTRLR